VLVRRSDRSLESFGLLESAVGAVLDVFVDRTDLADVATDCLDGGFEFREAVLDVVEAVCSLDRVLVGERAFDGVETTFDGVTGRFAPGHTVGWFRSGTYVPGVNDPRSERFWPRARTGPAMESEGPPADGERRSATIESLVGTLSSIRAASDDPDVLAEIEALEALLADAHDRELIDARVRPLGWTDVAQAVVGSVVFTTPLLVEDGVFDIASHLLETGVAGVPVFLLANLAFTVVLTYALLEWTGRETEETAIVAGVVPVRLLVVLGVSLAVVLLTMTLWGRLDAWQDPTRAVARVTVIWTVGALGAALGDIISGSDAPVGQPTQAGTETAGLSDTALLEAVYGRIDRLEDLVPGEARQRTVDRLESRTREAVLDANVRERVRKYTSRDVAESFVGSVVFAIPLLVEDGVFDVAASLRAVRAAGLPVFFALHVAFVVAMIAALLYGAGPRDVQVSRPIVGLIPRRLLGVAVVSVLTTAALMTLWGRVAWQQPTVAVARVSVVWTVAAFGAALGDVLPGESSGQDINDELAEFGDSVGEFVD